MGRNKLKRAEQQDALCWCRGRSTCRKPRSLFGKFSYGAFFSFGMETGEENQHTRGVLTWSGHIHFIQLFKFLENGDCDYKQQSLFLSKSNKSD